MQMFSLKPGNSKSVRAPLSGRVIDVAMCLFLLGMLGLLYAYTFWKAHHGIGDTDTAFFLDVLENTWHLGLPTTSAVRAFLNVYPFILMDPDKFCAIDQTQFSTIPANILLGHANLIVYPLSALAQWLGAERVAAISTASAFVALPAISYLFLRRRNVPAFLCLFFSVIVCLHPAWRIATEGWIYFDRLFMPFALAFAFLMHEAFTNKEVMGRSRMILVVVIAAIGAMIHERGALLMLVVALGHVILYRSAPRRNVLFVLAVSAALMAYLAVYSVLQHNVDNAEVYKSFFDLPRFLNNVFRPGLVKLIAFNLPFILLAALFNWRAALIAGITIFPNVIVSIGGAEKDGWITHYHSFYFPFVIYAGAVGLTGLLAARRDQYDAGTQGRWPRSLAAVFMLSLIGAVVSFLNPYGPDLSWRTAFIKEGLWRPVNDLYLIDPKFSSYRYETERADRLVAAIPAGASVTFMPPFNAWKLFRNHNSIQIFPVGTGVSEYLLVTFEKKADGGIMFDPVGVVGSPEGHLKARQCVTDKVWAAGYKPVMEINHYMLLRR